MKRYVILITCIVGFVFADWVIARGTSDEPLPPNKTVMASDSLSVIIGDENFGFIKEDTLAEGTTFQCIKIPAEPVDYDTINIGKPQIPYVKLLIAVPDSADFDITVYKSDYTLFEDYVLYPVPRIVFETDTFGYVYSKEVFVYDTSFYEKDTIYPNKFYEIMSDGHWREQRVLEVFLYPVQYNPQKQEMYFYAGINIKIEYLGEVVENTLGLGPFEELGRELLLNYPGIDLEPERVPPAPTVHYYTDLLNPENVADYIIVTHDDFLDNEVAGAKINSFAWWRVNHNHFDVGIVDMIDVYEQFQESLPDSAAVLREFLIHAYENWYAPHMPDTHFAYCLFIGDWDYVPIDTNTIFGALYLSAYEGYYRDLTSDNWEDIMLGRWPVKATLEPTDLITIADKTINYEEYPNPALGNWRRRGFIIGGPGPGYWSYCDPNINTAVTYFDDINYDTFTVRCPDSLTALNINFHDSVYKYLNCGDIIATFYGHGTWCSWGQYPLWMNCWFNDDHAQTLNNGDSLPVVLSYACLVGSFHFDHPYYDTIFGSDRKCLGDGFLINPNGGAVAFYGTTAPVWMSMYNTQPMLRILRHQDWTLGKALINTTPNTPNNCFCLLGDPALDLGDYTAYPNLPDLVVRPQGIDISLLQPDPYPDTDDSIPVIAKIWNIGGETAYDVFVNFACDEPTTGPYSFDFVTIPEILPLDTVTCIGYWKPNTSYGELGDCEFIVEVDPNNEINESWEYNNNSSIIKKIAIYPNQPGWPKKVIGCSQPAIGDVVPAFGLASAEIVCPGLDSIYVFDINGNNSDGWPQYFPNVHSVVLGDINDDNFLEVIAVSFDSVKVYNWTGDTIWTRSIASMGCEITRPPSLGRIANTSSPYLDVVIIGDPYYWGPFKVFVYDYNGDLLYEFESEIPVMNYDNLNPASISDINGDSKAEIVVSSYSSTTCFTTIFNKDGLINTLYYGNRKMTPALAKIDGDNYPDIITGGQDGIIRAYNAVTDSVLWETQTEGPINSSPAVGNINPLPEFPGNEIAFGNDANQIFAIKGSNGQWWYPWWLETNGMVRTSPALANIDNNSGLDIIIGSNDQYIYALNYDADPISPFPLPVFGYPSSPVIGDIDRDGKSETILTTDDGYIHVWNNMNSSVPVLKLEWPQFHHDYQRTGLYGWADRVKIKHISAQVFSEQTEMTFSLEENCPIQITVYNSQGEPVKTLINQNLFEGEHQVDWDGTDDFLNSLPNGSYIIEIKTEDEVETIPVVISR